jgi:hypothetical protein
MTKRFCLTLAAGALLAATPAAAQQPVTTYTTTPGTVITTPAFGTTTTYAGPTVITADESTTTRRGLFARLRARREARSMPATPTYGPVVGTPVYTSSFGAPAITTTPGTIVTPTQTVPPPTVPMQMPGKMSMATPTMTDWTATVRPTPRAMQTVVVNGMTYTVPATLPPEGVVVSERIITPTTGPLDRNVIIPASGTVVVPGTVTPATFTIPLQPMPRPR